MDPAARFVSIVQAPEDRIRLDEAALCISACVREGVDVDEWCGRIDDLAARVDGSTFDDVREHLFAIERFRGDTDDYGDPNNSFLDAVIERRRGIPITLSVLLMEVARRLGVPVFGIGMPGHFLVQAAGSPDRWCDPFHSGALLDRDDCARIFAAIHSGTRQLGADDLAPTSSRAILARMLANLEHGRLVAEPRRLAAVCDLHLAIPGLSLAEQVALLRSLTRAGDPALSERAYEQVAAQAPDDLATTLRAEAQRLRSRWN